MSQKVTQRRLTICGEVSVYEEVVTEPLPTSTSSPLPASMADKCATILNDFVTGVLNNRSVGNKQTITTIRAIRALTGCGLKEAKEAYEGSWK